MSFRHSSHRGWLLASSTLASASALIGYVLTGWLQYGFTFGPTWSVCFGVGTAVCFFDHHVPRGWPGFVVIQYQEFSSLPKLNLFWATYYQTPGSSDCLVIPLLPFILILLGINGYFCYRYFRPKAHAGRCRACNYDLRGNPTGRCPECGVENSKS